MVEQTYLDIDGLQYHYVDEGSGPPAVMVHGNPTWSYYYRNLVKTLQDTHRCIVPDHIGCGLSDKPDDSAYDYTLDSRVDNLEALLEHLEIDKDITLIVHDWGGMIGMAYAVRHPERIKRLVILNTAGFRMPEAKKFPFALTLCRNPLFGSFLVRGLNMFCKSAVKVGTKRAPLKPEVREALLKPYDSWKNRIAIHRFVQDIPLQEGDKAWETVSKVDREMVQFKDHPVLICWGLQDFIFDHTFLDEWTKRIPDAEVHRFEDCGHYILEDAAEELLKIIPDFIKRT